MVDVCPWRRTSISSTWTSRQPVEVLRPRGCLDAGRRWFGDLGSLRLEDGGVSGGDAAPCAGALGQPRQDHQVKPFPAAPALRTLAPALLAVAPSPSCPSSSSAEVILQREVITSLLSTLSRVSYQRLLMYSSRQLDNGTYLS